MDQQKRADLLDEIRRDIAASEQAIIELRRLETYLSAKVSANGIAHLPTAAAETTPEPAAAVKPPVAAVPAPFGSSPPVPFVSVAGMSQADAAASALRDIGRPLKTMGILDAMIARGYPAPAPKKKQNLANSIFSVMRRKTDRFRKIDKGFWGLVEWDNKADESKAAVEN